MVTSWLKIKTHSVVDSCDLIYISDQLLYLQILNLLCYG